MQYAMVTNAEDQQERLFLSQPFPNDNYLTHKPLNDRLKW